MKKLGASTLAYNISEVWIADVDFGWMNIVMFDPDDLAVFHRRHLADEPGGVSSIYRSVAGSLHDYRHILFVTCTQKHYVFLWVK